MSKFLHDKSVHDKNLRKQDTEDVRNCHRDTGESEQNFSDKHDNVQDENSDKTWRIQYLWGPENRRSGKSQKIHIYSDTGNAA
jgi:hypothetical protein